ncbi:MAG: hypothetical protein WDW38_010589 [Sanguina aurantia]
MHAGKAKPPVVDPFEHAVINTRIYSDGQTATSKQSFASSIAAMLSLAFYTGWPNTLLLLFCLVIFTWNKIALAILVALFSTLLLPAGPLLWPAFNQMAIFKTWREYFRFSYLFEEILDPKINYIFAELPHGCFPLGPLVAGTECVHIFPGFNIFSLAASSVFSVPLWRHFMTWIGSVPATPGNFKKLLKSGSVAVIVGGIAEMYMLHPKKEIVVLKDRKGFVRIAVEMGVPIVPVCGKSVLTGPKMSKEDPGFAAKVDEVHAAVMANLQGMYDRHKGTYGWADRPLEIV